MNREHNNGVFSVKADETCNRETFNNNSKFSSRKNRHHTNGTTNGTTNGVSNGKSTNGTTTKPAGFGATPHPQFDCTNVMEKLRNVEAGQDLLNSVYQNRMSPSDSIVEEIRNEARRKLLEPELLPEDVVNPVDKVFTIGCFDLFHPGHELLLKRMRAYGRQVCVGVHTSESIFQLKNIHPEDSTAKRMLNVKEYADVVFCVAGTDPTLFIVSAIDLKKGETALYIRGNDMANFPSKDVVSALMPIKLLPYTSGISSSQLRRAISSSNSLEADDAAGAESTESESNRKSLSTSSISSSSVSCEELPASRVSCEDSMDTTASSEYALLRADDEVSQEN